MPHAAHFYFTLCLIRSLMMLFLRENLYLEIDGDRLNWGSDINPAYQALSFFFLNPQMLQIPNQ